MATYSQPKPAGMPTWIDLLTPDSDAARAFYHALFNWEYDIAGPEYGGYTIARLGTQSTAGIVGNQPGAPPMPAAWGLYFATNNIEADVARAVELGAKVIFPAMAVAEFGSMATCEDPTGATFSFWRAGQHIGSQLTEDPGSAAWYELYSSDAKKARDFYTALLGATADPMPGDMEYYVLKQGETMFAGIMQIDATWGNFHPQWITYFSVANVDDAMTTIREHGGKIMSNIDNSPFGRMVAVMDPQGAAFKIVEPPAG